MNNEKNTLYPFGNKTIKNSELIAPDTKSSL